MAIVRTFRGGRRAICLGSLCFDVRPTDGRHGPLPGRFCLERHRLHTRVNTHHHTVTAPDTPLHTRFLAPAYLHWRTLPDFPHCPPNVHTHPCLLDTMPPTEHYTTCLRLTPTNRTFTPRHLPRHAGGNCTRAAPTPTSYGGLPRTRPSCHLYHCQRDIVTMTHL